MNYAKPLFSREQVNQAARTWCDFSIPFESDKVQQAISIIDNLRAAHAYPLNSFHMTLKRRASKINLKVITAQRIKRLISIVRKLLSSSDMKLSQMQDIAGCRAVLANVKDVYELRKAYRDRPPTHPFIGEKDYIASPKSTGYRGIHLKYRFVGTANSKPWDGLKVEIQLRTLLQHKWATAVEAAGTFTQEALKSNSGRPELLRFFSLISSVFAIREGQPCVPGTPSNLDELHLEIQQLNRQHHIANLFAGYHAIIPNIEKMKNAKYSLVTLDPVKMTSTIRQFGSEESQAANKAYTEAEKNLPTDSQTQVVLVSVSSISSLKKAYPNYFLDTKDFLDELRIIVATTV